MIKKVMLKVTLIHKSIILTHKEYLFNIVQKYWLEILEYFLLKYWDFSF